MLSFYKLAALAVLVIASASQAVNATLSGFTLNSYTCTTFSITIDLTTTDWNSAYYAVFYIADASDPTNNLVTETITVNNNDASGIQHSNTAYTFTITPTPAYIPQSASQWFIGLSLGNQAGNAVPGAFVQNTYPNKCLSSAASTTAPASTTRAISTAASVPTASSVSQAAQSSQAALPTQTGNGNGKKTPIGPIIGGVVGALAALAAMVLFLCLRKRKAAEKAAQEQNGQQYYSRDAGAGASNSMEKGYISNAPVDSVNQLPQRNYPSGVSDYVEKSTDYRQSSAPTMTSPPMSPRQSVWNAGGLPPVSSQTLSPPMSPTLSATSGASRSTNPLFAAPSAQAPMPAPASGPVRSNNPLMNFNVGNWSAGPTAEETSPVLPQPQQSHSQLPGSLPEPMSRH